MGTLPKTLAMAVYLGVCGAVTASGFAKNAGPNGDALVIKSFETRVASYVKLHKDVAAQLPPLKPTDSPAQINTYQRELAARIIAARPHAKQGYIFSPPVTADVRRVIARSMRGTEGTRIRASLRVGAPVNIPISVNSSYPSRAPLETTPPTLLRRLPKLPPEVEYRVVGHDLVLCDATANLIVDFVPRAIP